MGKIKDIFENILAEDINKQARRVELITIIVFIVLALVIWWLWQFQLDIRLTTEKGTQIIVKMNIFELLLSKY